LKEHNDRKSGEERATRSLLTCRPSIRLLPASGCRRTVILLLTTSFAARIISPCFCVFGLVRVVVVDFSSNLRGLCCGNRQPLRRRNSYHHRAMPVGGCRPSHHRVTNHNRRALQERHLLWRLRPCRALAFHSSAVHYPSWHPVCLPSLMQPFSDAAHPALLPSHALHAGRLAAAAQARSPCCLCRFLRAGRYRGSGPSHPQLPCPSRARSAFRLAACRP